MHPPIQTATLSQPSQNPPRTLFILFPLQRTRRIVKEGSGRILGGLVFHFIDGDVSYAIQLGEPLIDHELGVFIKDSKRGVPMRNFGFEESRKISR